MSTIYDVARHAGVSPKTVSRVLNNDAPVKEETRLAVEQAIQELGYIPSSAARALRSWWFTRYVFGSRHTTSRFKIEKNRNGRRLRRTS